MEDCLYRVSTKAVIFDDKRRVLMINYAAGLWGLPGGGVEHGEDPREALIRECQEEIGITVTNVSSSPVFVGTEDLTSSVWSCKLFYTAEWGGGGELRFEEGIKSAAFLSVEEIENRGLVGSGTFALEYIRSI